MNEKQYTLRQWSEIQGGHEMTETPKSQYSFISSLNESRMFRSKARVEGTNARDMADLAFMNMVTMYILYNENDFAVAAKSYAQRTMKYGGQFRYMQSGTDLHVALASLKNGMTDAGEKNELQLGRFNIPEQQIKQFLNSMRQGRKILSPETFFLKLERGLDIQNSNYRSVRRLAQNWPRLNGMQKKLVMTRLLQYYRTKALRSEMYSYVRDISRSQGLAIQNAHNAETPKLRATDTLAALATAGATLAGSYYLGKALMKGKIAGGMGDIGKPF